MAEKDVNNVDFDELDLDELVLDDEVETKKENSEPNKTKSFKNNHSHDRADSIINESVQIDSELESTYALKWQKEIDLHRRLDTAIIVEGNVNDEQVYQDQDGLEIVSTEAYFYKYLHSIGYKTVVFFDNVTGFTSKNDDELAHFHDISEAEKVEDIQEDAPTSLFNTESLNEIRSAMANKSEPVAIILCNASRYIVSPNQMSDYDNYFYSRLSLAAKTITKPRGNELHNIMFLIADKSNDIPAWFYLNNPYIKIVTIPKPDMSIRKMYIDNYYDNINEEFEEESEEIIKSNKDAFISYTDGFRIRDLDSIRILMDHENLPVSKISQGVSKFKYGIDENPWEDERLRKELPDLENKLKERVKGQDAAVNKAACILKSAVLGLSGLQHSSSKSKPRGVMFLAGPTGTGKTELAKAISQWIFKSDNHVIRFDMSEYSQAHTDQRLLGAPPGYVGYEQGGQLTEAVKANPFSVLLFDEIEKAHPSILDKFLQILEDGRMTDGKGETVYFSDCLIIFTSNLGMYKEKRDQFGNVDKIPSVNYGEDGCNEKDEARQNEMYNRYVKNIMSEIKNFFSYKIERPELLNRIGENFIIFNFISKVAAHAIMNKQVSNIKLTFKKQKNIDVLLSKDAQKDMLKEIFKEEHISQGGRGVGNIVELMLLRPISNYLVEHGIYENAEVAILNIVPNKGIFELVCKND